MALRACVREREKDFFFKKGTVCTFIASAKCFFFPHVDELLINQKPPQIRSGAHLAALTCGALVLPALTDPDRRPSGGLPRPAGHRITRVGHLDRQVALLQAPPMGLHTSLFFPLSLHPP